MNSLLCLDERICVYFYGNQFCWEDCDLSHAYRAFEYPLTEVFLVYLAELTELYDIFIPENEEPIELFYCRYLEVYLPKVGLTLFLSMLLLLLRDLDRLPLWLLLYVPFLDWGVLLLCLDFFYELPASDSGRLCEIMLGCCIDVRCWEFFWEKAPERGCI